MRVTKPVGGLKIGKMKRDYIQSIKIEFRCLEDLFNLPCVKGLVKDSAVDGGIMVRLFPSKMADGTTPLVFKDQWLCQQRDGLWVVENEL